MLYYSRIEVSEGIYVNKTSASKACIICHFCYFLGLKFQPYVCNGCHDLLVMSMNINGIAILNIHHVDYPCIIKGISKCEAINLLKILIKHKKWIITKYKNFFLSYRKMS